MMHCIDVSRLEPPEPMEVILDTLADMPADEQLRIRHRRDPVPLYRILQNLGYRWHTCQSADGMFEILVWPAEAEQPGPADGQPSPR
jgi:uncharacterized protein (DUF2249 family)